MLMMLAARCLKSMKTQSAANLMMPMMLAKSLQRTRAIGQSLCAREVPEAPFYASPAKLMMLAVLATLCLKSMKTQSAAKLMMLMMLAKSLQRTRGTG